MCVREVGSTGVSTKARVQHLIVGCETFLYEMYFLVTFSFNYFFLSFFFLVLFLFTFCKPYLLLFSVFSYCPCSCKSFSFYSIFILFFINLSFVLPVILSQYFLKKKTLIFSFSLNLLILLKPFFSFFFFFLFFPPTASNTATTLTMTVFLLIALLMAFTSALKETGSTGTCENNNMGYECLHCDIA